MALLILFVSMIPVDETGNNQEKYYKSIAQQQYDLESSATIFLKEYIKEGMKNPKSFEYVKTDSHYLGNNEVRITIVYRGTNSFGAIVTERLSVIMSLDGEILKINGNSH